MRDSSTAIAAHVHLAVSFAEDIIERSHGLAGTEYHAPAIGQKKMALWPAGIDMPVLPAIPLIVATSWAKTWIAFAPALATACHMPAADVSNFTLAPALAAVEI